LKLKVLTMLGIPIIMIAILSYFSYPWIAIYIGIHLEPNPPSPDIKYGEFPFRLEYEINGERKVIEDTLICEYDGIGSDEAQGKYRTWKRRLASGNERITLQKISDTKEIFYTPGRAEYYMGDLKYSGKYVHSFPNAVIFEKEGRMTSNRFIDADQLVEQYNIKLISWDYTQPIKNTFTKGK
jgi:hypothetical protein